MAISRNEQLTSVGDFSAHVVRQPAVGEARLVASFEHDDLCILVQASSSCGSTSPTGNTTDDDVMLGAAASKGIKNSGVPFANMARRDEENTFTVDQLIGGTNNPARLDLFQANQILESGRFNVESSSGFFSISSENDDGTHLGG